MASQGNINLRQAELDLVESLLSAEQQMNELFKPAIQMCISKCGISGEPLTSLDRKCIKACARRYYAAEQGLIKDLQASSRTQDQ